jgi:hypothetical protein
MFRLLLDMTLRLPMLDLVSAQHINHGHEGSRVDHAKVEWDSKYFLSTEAGSVEQQA